MGNERDIPFGALKIFSVVAESETLTSAAQKLGITQSAVSQALSQLESLTSTELVVRRSRPVRLTPAGEVLLKHAQQIIVATQRMLTDDAAMAVGGPQRLRVGVIDSFADVAGQALIDAITPIAATLSLQTGLTMPLSEALLERRLDVLITSDPLQDHPEFECHPILRDPFVVLVAESVLERGDADLAALADDLPFVRYGAQTRLGRLTDLVLRRAGVKPQARYEFDSTQSLMQSVNAGKGWAVATGLCAMQHPALLEGVCRVPLGSGSSARYVCLLARHGELGDAPEKIAAICRDIFATQMLPAMLEQMPWLAGEARTITDVPEIWSA